MVAHALDGYDDDAALSARQRLWEFQHPPFDLVNWVLHLCDVVSDHCVLDVGCGNGHYLSALGRRGVAAVGCDQSLGMVRRAMPAAVVNADVVALPFVSGAFDVVLAAHVLYHVDDRAAAVDEMRRVLAPGGVCVAVTNGRRHLLTLHTLIERAVHPHSPEWTMRTPATRAFSLENGAAQLALGFADVTLVRPSEHATVRLRDAAIAADYVASLESFYRSEVACDWSGVVDTVRRDVAAVIERDGVFVDRGDVGAFVGHAPR